jgi:hypothetical protein
MAGFVICANGTLAVSAAGTRRNWFCGRLTINTRSSTRRYPRTPMFRKRTGVASGPVVSNKGATAMFCWRRDHGYGLMMKSPGYKRSPRRWLRNSARQNVLSRIFVKHFLF